MSALTTESQPVPRSSTEELRDLDALRTRLRESLKDVSHTLIWFAEQQQRGGMPANIWTKLTLLPSPRMHGLSPTFDLVHTLQRLARTLRQYDDEASERVAAALRKLTDDLVSSVPSETAKEGNGPDLDLMRLISDDRTGTLTMESAARVLRCGAFPIRIPASGTYIAGHVIFSELRMIDAQFARFGSSMTVKRPPSAAFVVQGVAAVRSFVAMVRRRADTCEEICQDLKRIIELRLLVQTVNDLPDVHEQLTPPLDSALAAQERFLFTRLAKRFRRAGASILGLRGMFTKAANIAKDAPPNTSLISLFAPPATLTTASAHDSGRKRAESFVKKYGELLEELLTLVRDSPGGKPRDQGRTKVLLAELDAFHGVQPGDWAPTITHTARFRILSDLLKNTGNTLDLFKFNPGDPDSNAKATERAIAALCGSWELHLRAFVEPEKDPKSWIPLRWSVFCTARDLGASLLKAPIDDSDAVEAFSNAAKSYRRQADDIEAKLAAATRWAPQFAERLLFRALTGAPDRCDPNDLLSALWLCDRTGHTLPETLEERSAAALTPLQRADGSFKAGRPPVKLVHGFVQVPPSAATIAVLANFLREPPEVPTSATLTPDAYERRLRRWEPMCVQSTKFLLDARVGRHTHGEEMSGWHSDRQPEDERIDLLTTCIATRALCEMDALLSRFINRRAFEGLQVRQPGPPKKLFEFDSQSRRRDSDEQSVLISAERSAEWLEYHTLGFPQPGGLPPAKYRPRTTLYYGPPGTGKTFASELVADELRWPLVTVNPHHFLRGGTGFIAKVAAEIFERLHFTSNCCIIFDEFDQLVIDRNAQNLPSDFAMVTTTMLPLLADLHEHARRNNCVIAFATNYRALLDAAAIRHGRIDQQACVVYPDFASRFLFLLSRASADSPAEPVTPATVENCEQLANKTAMRAVSDLIDVAKRQKQPNLPPPSPALGPGHYDGMLAKLNVMSRRASSGGALCDDPSKRSPHGLRPEVERLVTCLGRSSTLAKISKDDLLLLALGPDVEQWVDLFREVLETSGADEGGTN